MRNEGSYLVHIGRDLAAHNKLIVAYTRLGKIRNQLQEIAADVHDRAHQRDAQLEKALKSIATTYDEIAKYILETY